MEGNYSISNPDYIYTSLLLLPKEPILFAGTSNGCVEVWRVDDNSKIAELRYLELNEFGEEIPIKDPVVNLTITKELDLVYAFMGNAAYCIDVHDLLIIEQIPISERVFCGNVSPTNGDICVLTESGYLSIWSAIFVERIKSLDLILEDTPFFLCFGRTEDQIILFNTQHKMLLINFSDSPYLYSIYHEWGDTISDILVMDYNDQHSVRLQNGSIVVSYHRNDIGMMNQNEFEKLVRDFIHNYQMKEDQKHYISDFRLDRLSRDRYVAELEHISSTMQNRPSLSADSKTLTYALEEYYGGTLEQKSRSDALINKIASRHDVDAYYLFLAFKRGSSDLKLIEDARYYEFQAYHRQKRIYQLGSISILLSVILLTLSETFVMEGYQLSLFLVPLFVQIFVILHWRGLNNDPKYPRLNEMNAVRYFMILTIFLASYLLINNSYPDLLKVLPM